MRSPHRGVTLVVPACNHKVSRRVFDFVQHGGGALFLRRLLNHCRFRLRVRDSRRLRRGSFRKGRCTQAKAMTAASKSAGKRFVFLFIRYPLFPQAEASRIFFILYKYTPPLILASGLWKSDDFSVFLASCTFFELKNCGTALFLFWEQKKAELSLCLGFVLKISL